MKKVKKLWEIPGKTLPEPYKRNVQVVYTPQNDEGIRDFTFLVVNLYPVDGQTDYHTHPVDEMIYIISGWGEAIVDGEKHPLEPGTIIYAPKGTMHQCRNLSDTAMHMACYFTPSLPKDALDRMAEGATVRVPPR